MKRLAVVLGMAAALQAATHTVCTSGCDYVSLTAAFAAVQAGDTLVLSGTINTAGDTLTKSNVTIVGNQSLLPAAGIRITPSHSAYFPKIVLTNNQGIVIPAQTPNVSGVTIRGVEITHSGTTAIECFVCLAETASSDTSLPGAITLEQVYIHGNFTNTDVHHAIVANTQGFTMADSWVEETPYDAQDGQGVASWGGPGPITLTNNWIVGASENVLVGGADLGYVDPPSANMVVEHNIFYKPYKWYSNSPNYIGRSLCLKNPFELKQMNGATIKWNWFENGGNGCGNQTNGLWFNPIMQSSTAPNGATVTISGGNQLSFTGAWALTSAWVGRVIAINTGSAWEAIPIATVTSSSTATTTRAYSTNGTFTNTANQIVEIEEPGWLNNNVDIENNLLVNTPRLFGASGMDATLAYSTTSYAVPEYPGGGNSSGYTFSNNLSWKDSRILCASTSTSGSPCGYNQYGIYLTNGVTNYTINHNTDYLGQWTYYAMWFVAGAGCSGPPWHNGLNVTNNLLQDGFMSANCDGEGMNYVGANTGAWSLRVQTGEFEYNTVPGRSQSIYEPCTGHGTCVGNFYQAWSNPFVGAAAGNYAVTASSPYHNAGTDGKDIGVDMTQLAMITDFTVTPRWENVAFDYTVPTALSGQTANIEVTTSTNLPNETGPYTVVDDVRPDYFPLSDTDQRAGTIVTGSHRKLIVGSGVIQNGHDRRLAPNTTYYYRFVIGGYKATGSFTTGLGTSTVTGRLAGGVVR